MPWPLLLASAFQPGYLAAGEPVTTDPLMSAAGQFLSYGVVGAVAIVVCFVLYRGTFTRSDEAKARIAAALADADKRVTEARADLLAENERLRVQLAKTEQQRDDLSNFIRDKMTPLLQQFVTATNLLLPVMQDAVGRREDEAYHHRPRGIDDSR